MSISISVDIDVIIDEASINLYRQKNKKGLSEDVLKDIMLLGTCGASFSTDCNKILDDLIAINKSDLTNPMSPFPEEESAAKCNVLAQLKTTKVDYYLAYIFGQKPGEISSIGDSNIIEGKVVITPFKPESASGKYGGKTPPTPFPCDPCEQNFKKLKYVDRIQEEASQLGQNRALKVAYDWSQHGFNRDNPLPDVNGDKITLSEEVPGTDAYGQPIIKKVINIPTDKYIVAKSKYGSIGLRAKYDGFNKWLYTKYYGGTNYSVVKTSEDMEGKVGIDLGKLFTVEATIINDPRNQDLPGLDLKNIIRVTITSAGKLDMYVTEVGGKAAKVTSNTTGKNIPPMVNVRDLKKYLPELRDGTLTIDQTFVDIPETIKNEVVLDCCPYNPEVTYKAKFMSNNKGRKLNLQLPIDVIQRAQGGIYNAGLQVPSETNPNAPNPCCEECNYCIFGELCPGLEGILQGIRDAEIVMRDHNVNPYSAIDYSTGDAIYKTARNPGPQCIAYDFISGWPVPKADFVGD